MFQKRNVAISHYFTSILPLSNLHEKVYVSLLPNISVNRVPVAECTLPYLILDIAA
jgi:hypothetical protein